MKIDEKTVLVFVDREGKPGGGKGLLISKGLTFTLSGLRQGLLAWESMDEGNRVSDPLPERPCDRGVVSDP